MKQKPEEKKTKWRIRDIPRQGEKKAENRCGKGLLPSCFVGMVIAFCTFGLKYMMTRRVVQAEAAPTDAAPKQTASATPLETPSPANVATISGTETTEATPELRPLPRF